MDESARLARDALARGDLVAAYDAASSAIAAGDRSSAARHLQVLALARMGDTDRALKLFADHGLQASADPHERALGARLLKDKAFQPGQTHERVRALRSAHESYLSIYRASGDPFPGINAATLAFLAGDAEAARAIAAELLHAPQDRGAGDYYGAVTRAEALFLLGRMDEAANLLTSPAVIDCRDYGARAGTLRQLEMILSHAGIEAAQIDAWLAPLAPPAVAHFSGHMFAADPAAEARVRARVEEVLEAENVGFVYGALACGSDLITAEAALAKGAELHVVLPFAQEDFLDQSVRPGGDGWEARFHSCLERAASLTLASATEFFGDSEQYSHGARVAMGLARLRARHLASDMLQLAIWDGKSSAGPAGTGADVAGWRQEGGRTRIVEPGAVDRNLSRPDPRHRSDSERRLAAILFTDFAGFSTLPDSRLPAFWDGVMRRVADILDRHDAAVQCRNSWGDALYAVIASAPEAARLALDIQEALAGFDYSTLGLAGEGGMRIAVHYGPAFRTLDPITGRTTFYGSEVSRAARIEPVTPPGSVFVTEPFAAILALEGGAEFSCSYVGRIPLAKKYGAHPMYRLVRNAASAIDPAGPGGTHPHSAALTT